jgi:hypothetical protein
MRLFGYLALGAVSSSADTDGHAACSAPESNTDFDGHDLAPTTGHHVADAAACCDLCAAMSAQGCGFWTLQLDSSGTAGTCYPKTTDAGRRTYAGATSGKLPGATPSPTPPPPPAPPTPPPTPITPPLPSAPQLSLMDMGLSQFMHFSVDPFTSIEHNCVGDSGACVPASVFNPSNLSTDQWVEAAVAMGAGEICLTAHHEGGFCLWDTAYSNYSVMHSPYGRDIVQDFVASCAKYGVKPCYYMGPNANGYLANNQSYSAEAFVVAQLGMLRELLTKYGDDYVSRLWWDHYPSGCGGLAPCPTGSFPDAWPRFVQLVRDVSPSTVICPGPDCDGHQGESGDGVYPAWFPCSPSSMANGSGTSAGGTAAPSAALSCGGHDHNAGLAGFHPYEACATMHNGWFTKGAGDDSSNTYWSPRAIWDHYMASVGQGWVNTLNAGPGTTGQIPQRLVNSQASFGGALRALLEPVGAVATNFSVPLNGSFELDLAGAGAPPLGFNALMLREDLSRGQRIVAYALDYLDGATGQWVEFEPQPPCSQHPYPSPPPPAGQCSAVMNSTNLVSGVPPGTARHGVTASAAACAAACLQHPTCEFYTWHDLTLPKPYTSECYLGGAPACFKRNSESGHFSGVCNNHNNQSQNRTKLVESTLEQPSSAAVPTTPAVPTAAAATTAGPPQATGVHAQSVGARLIDFVPPTTASKLRFRVTAAMASPVYLRSFSAHRGDPPSDTPP